MTRLLSALVLALAPIPGAGCFSDPGPPDIPADSGESAGDDSAADSTTEDTGATPASCDDYCALVAACDADFPQYTTVGPCESVCDTMPLGEQGDQTGNTVGCRTFYAILAGEGGAEKQQYCRNAGPSGNGVCGGLCESFCDIAMEACTGADQIFTDTPDCITRCMAWDNTEPYSSTSPEADTFACRLKHLTYATLDPGTHCGHAADMSTVCI